MTVHQTLELTLLLAHFQRLFHLSFSPGGVKLEQTHTHTQVSQQGRGQQVISRTYEIISTRSGRWQGISLQVTKTVSVNWSSSVISNRVEDGWRRRGGAEDEEGEELLTGQ